MKKSAIALAAISLIVTGVAGALTIDEFNAGEMSIIAVGPPPRPNQAEALPVADVLGGARKLRLTNVTGTSNARRAMVLVNDEGSHSLSVSNDDLVNSRITVIWDGSTANPNTVVTNGLGGIDLTAGGGTAFVLSIPSIDQHAVVDLTVWAGGAPVTVRQTFLEQTPEYRIAFARFSGIDFSQVGAIQMVFSGPASWDGSILLAKTDAPAPATIALMTIGLLGLSRTRRCR